MWHGSLEGDELCAARCSPRRRGGSGAAYEPGDVSFAEQRERRLDLLGDLAEEHLDLDALLDLATAGAPAGMPALEPGASR